MDSTDIAACRDEFFQVLAALEAATSTAAAATRPAAPAPIPGETDPTVTVKVLDELVVSAPAASPAGAGPGNPGTFIVFFDVDTGRLSEEAEEILSEVVRAASESSGAKILAAGHADLAGPAAYNEDLAKRRADAVVQYLVRSGVDKLRLESESFGERKPLIPTDQDEFQLQNRRVEIQFLSAPGAD